MQRLFALNIIDNKVILNEEDSFHLKNVLRMKINEEVEIVFNNDLYIAYVSSLNPFNLNIKNKIESKGELKNDVTLFFVLSKGEKNDLITQKCTELGVNNIVFLESERCILNGIDFSKKKERLEKIAIAASKQSRRMKVPFLSGNKSILNLNENDLSIHNFFAYESISGTTKEMMESFKNIKKGESVSILIGPEGGISEKEADHLKNIGFKAISLGNRILRSETAAITSIGALSFFLELL